ncbi:hypothetical protein EVAR_42946_1 [Eumeta japonica]|uniref:Uncharacterized protein n=1 Tax=Eumeta variegata TaxID=151549 RepID=A0A4C1YFL2_EUMVA|nr:hypothetical protein EVAR_42946_1 [Eumeta japonica]
MVDDVIERYKKNERIRCVPRGRSRGCYRIVAKPHGLMFRFACFHALRKIELLALFPRLQRQGVSPLVRWNFAWGPLRPLTNSSDAYQTCSSTSGTFKCDITEIDKMQKEKFNTSQFAGLDSPAVSPRSAPIAAFGVRPDPVSPSSKIDCPSPAGTARRRRILPPPGCIVFPSIVLAAIQTDTVDERQTSIAGIRRPYFRSGKQPPQLVLLEEGPLGVQS